MAFRLEYSIFVKSGPQRSFPAWLFPAIISFLALVSVSFAQGNNSTSSGSGHAGASAPSVSAAASHASVPANSGVTTTTHTHSGNGNSNGNGNGNGSVSKKPNPQQTGYGAVVVYPYLYGVAVPYAVDNSDAAPDDEDADDAHYQGGPTVFDRRGSGADSYIPPVDAPPAHAQSADTQDDDTQDAELVHAESEVREPASAILVFKDGHQMEIQNYAVVGQTLYDLTSGRPRKISLADLDLPATEKLNDDRGVSFDLPSGQAN
jgi:hypothetical protein